MGRRGTLVHRRISRRTNVSGAKAETEAYNIAMKKFTLEIEAVNNGYRVRMRNRDKELFTGIADKGLPFGCTVNVREFHPKPEFLQDRIVNYASEQVVTLKMEGAH